MEKKNLTNNKTDIDIFFEDLIFTDIDLCDKLSNMSENEITEELAEYIMNDYDLQTKIEENVTELAPRFKDFIVDEAESLFAQDLTENLDYTSGLYNCDELYVLAIMKAIGFITIPNNKF